MSKKKPGPVSELKARLEETEARCAEHRDAALRAAADFDNYRRRAQAEMADARRRGVEAVMCDVVPVLDNFERALAAEAGSGDSGRAVEAVRRGVELIRRQLREALAAHGLAEFSCVGEAFDPRHAEAVGFVESDEHEPETVVAEECRGYRCGERVIRPARVVVARAPGCGEQEGGEREDAGRAVEPETAPRDS
ncbi:MAG TPA: nucleotide exchange factor GrpE [candidate division WOR-3 bacterium]|uniref:Protein GrpE n=1 Tax=candidate division WOR-3 bacterium TaxID=2052148 RepID=A0A7V0T4I6_UNCW3|nr:nucleotide exchange factor GrpE [candidate division WOR-3 bacterium]